MKSPDFDTLFESAATELLAAAKRSSIGARPDEVGSPRERAMRDFLSEWLPETYGVASGYVVNLQRGISKQSDVLVYRKECCPKFLLDRDENRRLIPIEELFGVVEVKSTLTKKELLDAISKCESVTDLHVYWPDTSKWNEFQVEVSEPEDRPQSLRVYDDREWRRYTVRTPREVMRHSPPFGAVCAYKLGSDLTLENAKEILEDKDAGIDCVAALDAGVLFNYSADAFRRYKSLKDGKSAAEYRYDWDVLRKQIERLKSEKRIEYMIEPCNEPHDALLFFYVYLFDLLRTRRLPEYDPLDYLAVWKSRAKTK